MALSDIIGSVLEFAVSSGIAVGGWKWVENILKNKKIRKSTKALSDMALVYDHLNYVSQELNTDRTLLVYTSNGGGIPSVAKSIFFTILYEVKDSNAEPIRSHFQNVLVDEQHTILLNKVLKDTCIIEEPKNLQDSFLKNNYIYQNVEHFAYVEVYRGAERFYYMALNWHNATRVPEEDDIKAVCQSAANNIKTILTQG